MNLLPSYIRERLPPLSVGKREDVEITAVAKLYMPLGTFGWYVAEFDGEDVFWGLQICYGDMRFDYFSISELESFRDNLIERDEYFTSKPMQEIETYYRKHKRVY